MPRRLWLRAVEGGPRPNQRQSVAAPHLAEPKLMAHPLFRPARPQQLLAAAFLCGTLGLAAILAYEAQSSARSHRALAENTLRDHARSALWQLGEGVRGSVR